MAYRKSTSRNKGKQGARQRAAKAQRRAASARRTQSNRRATAARSTQRKTKRKVTNRKTNLTQKSAGKRVMKTSTIDSIYGPISKNTNPSMGTPTYRKR